jgi:hypothetical protein
LLAKSSLARLGLVLFFPKLSQNLAAVVQSANALKEYCDLEGTIEFIETRAIKAQDKHMFSALLESGPSICANFARSKSRSK